MSPRKLTTLAALASVLGLGLSVAGAQTVVYVVDDAALGGDGATWPTAYKYLQDALIGAPAGSEIRVAQGTYKLDQDEAGNLVMWYDAEAPLTGLLSADAAGVSLLSRPRQGSPLARVVAADAL